MDFQGRFTSKCQTCGKDTVVDYIKYSWEGFDLLYMICQPCFLHMQIMGLRNLKGKLESFRATLRTEAAEKKLGEDTNADSSTDRVQRSEGTNDVRGEATKLGSDSGSGEIRGVSPEEGNRD